jgi:hypothetical protein
MTFSQQIVKYVVEIQLHHKAYWGIIEKARTWCHDQYNPWKNKDHDQEVVIGIIP